MTKALCLLTLLALAAGGCSIKAPPVGPDAQAGAAGSRAASATAESAAGAASEPVRSDSANGAATPAPTVAATPAPAAGEPTGSAVSGAGSDPASGPGKGSPQGGASAPLERLGDAAAVRQFKQTLTARLGQTQPKQWGETVTGVKRHLTTQDKVAALTFDACGGAGGSGYDQALIAYLTREQIPATLFINERWIRANPTAFAELAANPLFEIENHGAEHKPLSVTGKFAYGIAGTVGIGGVIDEVLDNAQTIRQLTGKAPRFFRSGTDYYDEIAVQTVQALGEDAVGYSVLGDAGATYNTQQVKQALLGIKPGAIVIAHMNHPEKDTAEGVMAAVPELRKEGYRFVRLEDYPLK